MSDKTVTIIGAGLAGCEAAYQLLVRGFSVEMYEMRPKKTTPAHTTDGFAELVCSNSLKSTDTVTGAGLLKAELEVLDSLLIKTAKECAVPAGSALAVNRETFSAKIKQALTAFGGFRLICEEVTEIDTGVPSIIASGPLTSDALAQSIKTLTGAKTLNFYDAVAPIIDADSVDMGKAFFGARYGKGEPTDYLNCAMDKAQYEAFYNALISAECVILKEFEKREIYEGCMPVEIMAKRGKDTVRFGPLKPVGFDRSAYAVVQLRRENAEGTMYNMVGFQTNLRFPEQKRVFGMIPGLENAEFLRYGVMHRNTYLDSPGVLSDDFSLINSPRTYFAGQITGVEGYTESIASGLMAGINMADRLFGRPKNIPPGTTLCGALARYVAADNKDFQPMGANFGLLPTIYVAKDKKQRKELARDRALGAIIDYKRTI